MWKLTFTPYDRKQTVGTLTAVFTDQNTLKTFEFQGSVNLDDAGSVADFKAQATKSLSAVSADNTAQVATDAKLAAIETALNK